MKWILAVRQDKFSMVILSLSAIARSRPSGERAMEATSRVCWMTPSWLRVNTSQIVTVWPVEYTIKFPCFGAAMHELESAGHSAEIVPVDASICWNIVLFSRHEKTKRWSLLCQRTLVAFTSLMSRIKRPSLLSQILIECPLAVAIRLPCGEYVAASASS